MRPGRGAAVLALRQVSAQAPATVAVLWQSTHAGRLLRAAISRPLTAARRASLAAPHSTACRATDCPRTTRPMTTAQVRRRRRPSCAQTSSRVLRLARVAAIALHAHARRPLCGRRLRRRRRRRRARPRRRLAAPAVEARWRRWRRRRRARSAARAHCRARRTSSRCVSRPGTAHSAVTAVLRLSCRSAMDAPLSLTHCTAPCAADAALEPRCQEHALERAGVAAALLAAAAAAPRVPAVASCIALAAAAALLAREGPRPLQRTGVRRMLNALGKQDEPFEQLTRALTHRARRLQGERGAALCAGAATLCAAHAVALLW